VVLIFAQVAGSPKEVKLRVTVTIGVSIEPSIPGIDLPSQSFTYELPMLPVAWSSGWYISAIPGFPTETEEFEFLRVKVKVTVATHVSYSLLIDGRVVVKDGYSILEGKVEKRLPPMVIATLYDVLADPTLIEKNLGLGPKGWTVSGGEAVKVLIVAVDEKGIEGIGSLEYSVSGGSWVKAPVSTDIRIQPIEELVTTVNDFIDGVEQLLNYDLLPDIRLSIMIATADIPGLNVGNSVMFRASATDVDGNKATSLMGLYYVVNKASAVKVLIIDPHVWLWLCQQNFKQFADKLKQSVDYELPEDVKVDLAMANKVADILQKHGIEPFHHWEMIGKHYDLYIAWPDEKIPSLLDSYKPRVIILSDLKLGIEDSHHFNWDLRDLGVQDDLISYLKENHAGLIATHGTLSDWVIWAGCKEEKHHKMGARSHVGDTIEEINPLEERTIASLLGLSLSALWEYVRDEVASTLCLSPQTTLAGLALGSTPLQVSNIPFDGYLKATPEATHVGWDIPSEFKIHIPSIYEEFGFQAYTQVGWQLAMPRSLAYVAWWRAEEAKPKATELYGKLSKLVEEASERLCPSDRVLKGIEDSLSWSLKNLYKSIISADIADNIITLTVTIPDLDKNVTMTVDISAIRDKLLQLMPTKLVAISERGLAGIVTYDRYWDESGYRSVYFSFEVEAAEGEIVERLLVNAIEWTTKWSFTLPDYLKGLLPMPKELVDKFETTLAELLGEMVLSEGLMLNEEGVARVKLMVPATSTLHLLVTYPQSEEVEVSVISGPATLVKSVKVADHLTRVTINVAQAGDVILGFKAEEPANLALSSAYLSVMQEIALLPVIEPLVITTPTPEQMKVLINATKVIEKGLKEVRINVTMYVQPELREVNITMDRALPEEIPIVINLTQAIENERIIKELTLSLLDQTLKTSLRVHLPKGVRLPVEAMLVKMVEMPPEMSEGWVRILPVVDIGPSGIEFDKPMTLNFTYTDEFITRFGVNESLLTIAYYDEALAKWIPVDSVVDVERDFVYTMITHLTPYTIVALPPPKPAEIRITDLSIEPAQIQAGQPVSISVKVTNVGELTGSYTVELVIAGELIDSRTVTLAGGESTVVTFEWVGEEPGTYSIDVAGLKGTVTIVPPVVPPPIPWTLFGVALVAIVGIALAIVFARRSKVR
jgi:hypothetical protein